MRFDASDDALALLDVVTTVLDAEVDTALIRAGWPGGDAARVDAAWRHVAATGAVGTLVPEARGGLGLDENCLVLVMEALGRSGVPFPVVETIAVAAPLLAASHDPSAAAVLDELLGGSARAAATLERPRSGGSITRAPGAAFLVPYGARADYVVLGTTADAGLYRRDDLDVGCVASVDGARTAARITVSISARSIVVGSAATAARTWQRGVLATAACLLGLSRRMLDMTVTYTKDRCQFGVPIASFQAIKHALAEALVALEFARPMALAAAWSVAENTDDAGRLVSAAKVQASDAARLIARSAIQCHGALGYTTEYDLHLFAKRAWALAAGWGDAAWHRADLARSLEVPHV